MVAEPEPKLSVSITSGFWKRYQTLLYEKILPYQWSALNDEIEGAPKSHSIENFRIAAGTSNGEFHGMVFQDSDLAKWLEAAGYVLEIAARDDTIPDEVRRKLGQRVTEAVAVVAAAQQPDGYLNTYFTAKEPNRRWSNLREAHELYCAGHMIEAGVAVYRGTGDRTLLDVVIRFADHIATVFGRDGGKRRGYPGHQEIELALVKLYKATGERRFLGLAEYFIDERGAEPSYFDLESQSGNFKPIWGPNTRDHAYNQAHAPVREQRTAVGHSVRAMYQYIAMADLAIEARDASLAEACRALWDSTVKRRMYVTGGIGSSRHGEAFTIDFDLPNDTAYAETCAAIGLFIFAHRMAELDDHARYCDTAERVLYNAIISGLSLDGTRYFYVNPLEVEPSRCDESGTYEHVKYRRQSWYGCACCPPNVARILGSLGDYVYRTKGNTVFVDHFLNGTASLSLDSGTMELEQSGKYPWDGRIGFTVTRAVDGPAGIAVRIPDWCDDASLTLNGEPVDVTEGNRDGYVVLHRTWQTGDTLELDLPMPVRMLSADPRIAADYGKVAIQRGPLVYCLEQCDNGPGLHTVTLPESPEFSVTFHDAELGGVTVITARGFISTDEFVGETPYAADRRTETRKPVELKFVPYYAWANRAPGEMTVWVRRFES
ncbi:MAG: glycoside hydrolase family 127 protein [Spirochaetaceae bacterium]|nr:MAG: glycoside hydrolase family 127 protein [Spirochaetaceae bacterium]